MEFRNEELLDLISDYYEKTVPKDLNLRLIKSNKLQNKVILKIIETNYKKTIENSKGLSM